MSIDEKELDALLPLAQGHHHHFSVVLLTQEHCGFCEQARDVLERLSHEYWLSVSTLDMASPEGLRLAMQGGLLFPPGVLINGKPFSYGRLSERKLRRELDKRLGFVESSSFVLASQPART